MGKTSISAASAKLKSGVKALALYPKDAKTVNIALSQEAAVDFATQVLAVARSESGKGKQIKITGHPESLNVTVIRFIENK